MMADFNYYSVTKGNEEDTTVLPGDSFNFEVKVLYHSEDTFPAGIEHRISPASIPSQDFFQEGPSFLQSVLSLSPYTITCQEEVAEGVFTTIQYLFRVYNVPDFLSLESHQESERRVIPLTVSVIILDYEFLRGPRQSPRPPPRRSPRLSARSSPRPSSRVTPISIPTQRPRSRLSERPISGPSERPSSSVNPRQNSEVNQRPSSSGNQRPSSSGNQRQNSEVNRTPEERVLINMYLKKCNVMRGRENCCICLEVLNANAECYAMACEHGFHLPCILTWLKTTRACPLCRYSLPTGEKPTGEN